MANCWANIIGGCSREQSGEHVISKSIFSQDELNVEGARWLSGRQVLLPKLALTAAILCKRHNELLSELDAEAGRLSSAIRQLYEQAGEHPHSLNGHLYERWALKTLVNIHVSGWAEGGKAPDPPLELVELIFGVRKLAPNTGLYAPAEVKGTDAGVDLVRWAVLTRTNPAGGSLLSGIYLELRGFTTFTMIPPGDPQPLVRNIGQIGGRDVSDVTLVHRPHRLVIHAHQRDSRLLLEIRW